MNENEIDAIKELIASEARALHPQLISMSHTIHENPETLFEEHKAAALLTNELEEHGFDVQRGVAGLDTAFIATYGSGEPVIGILAEYDALPKIGHACGHNLIGTWGVGAGIILRRAIPDLGLSFPVWLVAHRELNTSRRIRIVYDLLAEELAKP